MILAYFWLSCFNPLVFSLPKTFTLFGLERRWRLFQKRVVRNTFDIYVGFFIFIFKCFHLFPFYLHKTVIYFISIDKMKNKNTTEIWWSQLSFNQNLIHILHFIPTSFPFGHCTSFHSDIHCPTSDSSFVQLTSYLIILESADPKQESTHISGYL